MVIWSPKVQLYYNYAADISDPGTFNIFWLHCNTFASNPQTVKACDTRSTDDEVCLVLSEDTANMRYNDTTLGKLGSEITAMEWIHIVRGLAPPAPIKKHFHSFGLGDWYKYVIMRCRNRGLVRRDKNLYVVNF